MGVPLNRKLGGKDYVLPLISRDDLMEMMDAMPVIPQDRPYITPQDALRWAGTLRGSEWVITRSYDHGYARKPSPAELAVMGSVMERQRVAQEIVATSLTDGDSENAVPNS